MGPSQPKPAQLMQPAASSSQTVPRPPRRRCGMLHLRSCGDLSTFTCAALQSPEQQGNRGGLSRAGSTVGSTTGSRLGRPDRPHSLIGVFRETVLWGTNIWTLNKLLQPIDCKSHHGEDVCVCVCAEVCFSHVSFSVSFCDSLSIGIGIARILLIPVSLRSYLIHLLLPLSIPVDFRHKIDYYW